MLTVVIILSNIKSEHFGQKKKRIHMYWVGMLLKYGLWLRRTDLVFHLVTSIKEVEIFGFERQKI